MKQDDRFPGEPELRCPSCGSLDVLTTLIGCPLGHNTNRVRCCKCSLTGIAQDWIDKDKGIRPDDVFTLDVINAAMKRLKELKIQGEPVIYLWPDGQWTCTLCGHIQPLSKTTCQGCGKEELSCDE